MEVSSQSRQTDGSYKNDLSVRVSSRASLALGLQQDNSIDISFPRAPRYQITAYKLGEGEWQSDTNNTAANDLIKSTIGLILNQIATPFANIRLPSFLCVQFVANNISAIGGDHSHLNFSGSFALDQAQCGTKTNPELTAYGRGAGVEPYCGDDQEESNGVCYQQCPAGYIGRDGSCFPVNESEQFTSTDLVDLSKAGFGAAPSRCTPGDEKQGDVCYPRCNAGYRGTGSLCVSNLRPSYNRAAIIPNNVFNGQCGANFERIDGLCYVPCNSGYVADGAVCRLSNPSYDRGLGYQPVHCLPGQSLEKGRCVSSCPPNTVRAFDRCVPTVGNAVGRGQGVPPNQCTPGYEFSQGKCYRQCKAGFVGVGSICSVNP